MVGAGNIETCIIDLPTIRPQAPGYRQLTTQTNFGDAPFAADDFAFGAREGLLPVPDRQGETAYIAFDFELQWAADQGDEEFSTRAGAFAEA